jgi:hypothetical protein
MWRSQTEGKQARAITMSKLTKHTTLFQHKHVLEFGLKIVELEEKGNTLVVMSVCCLFFMYHDLDVEFGESQAQADQQYSYFQSVIHQATLYVTP